MTRILWLFVILLSSVNVNADEISVLAQLGLHTFQYREFDTDGSILDREDGNLRGFRFGLEVTGEQNRLLLDIESHGGEVDYEGHLQDLITSELTPFNTTTEERINLYRLTLARHIGRNSALRLGLGKRVWERQIAGSVEAEVASVNETYQWSYVSPGFSYAWQSPTQLRIEFRADVMRAVSDSLYVDVEGWPNFTLDLGRIWGWRLETGLRTRPSPSGLAFQLDVYREYWDIARGPIKEVSGLGAFLEPASLTAINGLRLGVVF